MGEKLAARTFSIGLEHRGVIRAIKGQEFIDFSALTKLFYSLFNCRSMADNDILVWTIFHGEI